MPQLQQKPCASPGCPNLTRERYYDQHKQQESQYDRERGTAAQFIFNFDISTKESRNNLVQCCIHMYTNIRLR
jgi:GAF domain-containing protein